VFAGAAPRVCCRIAVMPRVPSKLAVGAALRSLLTRGNCFGIPDMRRPTRIGTRSFQIRRVQTQHQPIKVARTLDLREARSGAPIWRLGAGNWPTVRRSCLCRRRRRRRWCPTSRCRPLLLLPHERAASLEIDGGKRTLALFCKRSLSLTYTTRKAGPETHSIRGQSRIILFLLYGRCDRGVSNNPSPLTSESPAPGGGGNILEALSRPMRRTHLPRCRPRNIRTSNSKGPLSYGMVLRAPCLPSRVMKSSVPGPGLSEPSGTPLGEELNSLAAGW